MPSAMPDRKRVALMVDEETKERWQTAVEESTEYRTLSGLIRQSVSHELSDGHSAPTPREVDSEAFSDLADSLRRIESKIDDLDSRISRLEGDTADAADSLTKTKIFSALNSSDEAMSTERLANMIGFPLEQVQDQLDELEEVTGMLETFEGPDGTPRYYTDTDGDA